VSPARPALAADGAADSTAVVDIMPCRRLRSVGLSRVLLPLVLMMLVLGAAALVAATAAFCCCVLVATSRSRTLGSLAT
jgi:hypothetical protein